jgi:hypothetical protein
MRYARAKNSSPEGTLIEDLASPEWDPSGGNFNIAHLDDET